MSLIANKTYNPVIVNSKLVSTLYLYYNLATSKVFLFLLVFFLISSLP